MWVCFGDFISFFLKYIYLSAGCELTKLFQFHGIFKNGRRKGGSLPPEPPLNPPLTSKLKISGCFIKQALNVVMEHSKFSFKCVVTVLVIHVLDDSDNGRMSPNFKYIRDITIIEPVHETSNNVVCATSKASDQPAHTRSDQSLCWSLEYSMIVKLLNEHHLEFLSLKRGCRGSS